MAKAFARLDLVVNCGKTIEYRKAIEGVSGRTAISGDMNDPAVDWDTIVMPTPAVTSAQAIVELGVSMTTTGATPADENASSIW